MINGLISELGLRIVRQERRDYLCTCPVCSGVDKLSIDKETGLWKCWKGCGGGNPLQLVRFVRPAVTDQEIFTLLDNLGLGDGTPQRSRTTDKPKKLWLNKGDYTELPLLDQRTFCEAKGIDRESFLKLKPYRHTKANWVLLPAYSPKNMNKPTAVIRAAIDGSLINIAGNDQKYPVVAGSRAGLLGLHNIATTSLDTPLLYAEGWKDAIAAISLGFSAIAPALGASSWSDDWLDFFKNRTVYAIFDADITGSGGIDEKTGRYKTAASIKLARRIHKVAKAVYIVHLPYEIVQKDGKDLHDYVMEDKHSKDDLQALLDNATLYDPAQDVEQEAAKPGEIVLINDHPDTFAEEFERWSKEQCDVAHKYNSTDGWTIYNKGRYQKVEDEQEIETYIRRFIQTVKIRQRSKQEDGTFKTYNVKPDKKHKSPAFIHSIIKWLRDMPDVHLLPSQKAPCSLDGKLDARNVLAANNCLVDLENNKTYPITEQFYTFNYLSYDYEPGIISSKWNQFLIDITMNNIDLIVLLQQWCGYLLIGDNRYQKFLLCVGDGANGKGVFFDTIAAVLGKYNVSNVPLACFSDDFKLFSTYGKVVNMSNENAKHLEANAESIIKEYVGGDKMLWRQLYKSAFSAYPTAKLMFATNILPTIRDSSDGIWRRMLYVPFDRQFAENQQNRMLTQELQKPEELAGILNWMIDGRKMLLDANGFTIPAICKNRIAQYRDESNSARLFCKDYLEDAPVNYQSTLSKSSVYKKYQEWCDDNGYAPKSNVHFGKDLLSCFPAIKTTRLSVIGEGRIMHYKGIKWQDMTDDSNDIQETEASELWT